MTSLVDNEVEQGAGRLRAGLTTPGLARSVAAYFDSASDFAGMTFSSMGSNPPGAVTADDLLAVSLLDIEWRPHAVRQLLGSKAGEVSRLLAPVRDDLDLWDATDCDLAVVDDLWEALTAIEGIGTATAAKLLARKRPRLCPVTDKVVVQAAGVRGHRAAAAVRCLVQDPQARAEIEALRPPEAAGASLLRIFDVAMWLLHSPSRAANRARAAGLSLTACA
jgi:hypothetical protein